jgi:ABC-type sugar transport system ATPase subunit
MRTLNYQVITVPNGLINTSILVNESREDIRRVDLEFAISYDSDIAKAKEVLASVCRDAQLVLDEPAAGLDPRGRRQIFDTMVNYQKATGTTVLIVSHSMEDMAQYCDEIVVLSGGKMILHGDREEVFSHADLLEEVGLDVPQITRLTRILREGGIELPPNVYTVDRAVELLAGSYANFNQKGIHS